MRKAELQYEADYKPFLADLEELEAVEQAQPSRRFARNRFDERLKSAAKSKRSSHDSEELMKIFSQLMTNNMRLKSNIKTSRF